MREPGDPPQSVVDLARLANARGTEGNGKRG